MDALSESTIAAGVERLELSSQELLEEHDQDGAEEAVGGRDDQAREFPHEDERSRKEDNAAGYFEKGEAQTDGELEDRIPDEFPDQVIKELKANVTSAEVELGEAPKKIVSSLTVVDLSLLRSLSKPPPLVKSVLESVFLILGHKEKDLKEWPAIKRLLAGTGKNSLKALCINVETWNLKGDVVSLVKSDYLSKYSVEKVANVSSAGAVLAKWVAAVVKEAEHYLAYPSEADLRSKEATDKLGSESKSAPARKPSPQQVVKIAALDRRCVSDLKAMAKPPKIVVDVLSAVNVLLGHDITQKQDWREIKKGLNARLVQACTALEPSKVALASAEFAKAQYLNDMTEMSVAKISSAAASFYVWARSMIKDVETWHQCPDAREEIEERRRMERKAPVASSTAKTTGEAPNAALCATTKPAATGRLASVDSRIVPSAHEGKGSTKLTTTRLASGGSTKTKSQVSGSSDRNRPALSSRPANLSGGRVLR